MSKKYIWMTVTQDKYEHPIQMAGSAKELAEIIGTTENSIKSSYHHYLRGDYKSCQYRRVEA